MSVDTSCANRKAQNDINGKEGALLLPVLKSRGTRNAT